METTNLAKIRREMRLSQPQLAKKAGVSVQVIRNYEQRQRNINNATGAILWRISRALNCFMEDLLELNQLEGDEPPFFF